MHRSLLCFLILTLAGASLLSAQQYPLTQDSQPQPNTPHGTLTQHDLPPGQFYPGTPHHYSLYVAAGLDPQKPAPFLIFLDGNFFLAHNVNAPVVLDNLIAKHDLPPLIAIFIDPGVLPAVSANAQNRYERVFEYDSLSDRYARFLIEELLPEVENVHPISHNPDDGAVAGISTGAVGAFMAAWNRPDRFHRVLSFIGTYVAMKGADSLPALIRKTEAKPLRIFLQDGNNDHIVPAEPYGTFFAGSWPVNNQVMHQALDYSGYDSTLVTGTGGHDMNQGAAILPDALRWLWRGYPTPIVVHPPTAENEPGWDPRAKVASIVSPAEPWVRVGPAEGPLAITDATSPSSDAEGNVYVLDTIKSQIYLSKPSDSGQAVTLFHSFPEQAQALTTGPDGHVYVAEPTQHRIVSYFYSNSSSTIQEQVVDQGMRPLALAATSTGRLYAISAGRHAIAIIDPGQPPRSIPLPADLAQPAGLTLSPDQAMLIVTDAQGRFAWSFQLASDGEPINGEPFYRLEIPESGVTSQVLDVREDTDGQVYFATPYGIQVCEANGRMAAILNPPEPGPITALTFGGPNQSYLYVVVNGKLYRRKTKVSGADVAHPAKLLKPPL